LDESAESGPPGQGYAALGHYRPEPVESDHDADMVGPGTGRSGYLGEWRCADAGEDDIAYPQAAFELSD
jgi:hypothetical protein